MSKCHGGSVEKSSDRRIKQKKILVGDILRSPQKNFEEDSYRRFLSRLTTPTAGFSDFGPSELNDNYGPKSENPAVGVLNLEIYSINLPQFFFGD